MSGLYDEMLDAYCCIASSREKIDALMSGLYYKLATV